MKDTKHFAKLSKNSSCGGTRDYGMNAVKIIKDYKNLDEVFEEMEEWAKSRIWYAHLSSLSDELQKQLTDLGFGVYEYFGEIGISWANSRFDGMVKFEKEKHLYTLESGDLLCGRMNGEGLNFYMTSKTTANVGTSMFTVDVVAEVECGALTINEIQKKDYWEN